LDDDLGTPEALAAVGAIAKQANDLADIAQKRKKDGGFAGSAGIVARAALTAVRAVADRLGVLQTTPDVYAARTRARRIALRGLSAQDVERRIAERSQARDAKDFARADAI